MRASSVLNKGAILLLLPAVLACQPKEKEKIVYIEVPVEKATTVEVEKVSEVQVPGATVTKTVEKEVQVQVPAESVDTAVVALNPGTLALSTGVSLVPPKGEGSVQGRPALRGLRLLDWSATNSEYDSFEEDIVIWNPAQEPLKNVNNFLCVIGKTGYNKAAAENSAVRLAADKDAAVEVDTVYIAKVTTSECKGRDNTTAAGGNGGSSQAKKAPIDITVRLFKEKNKPLLVSLWYSVKISDLLNMGSEYNQNNSGSDSSAEDTRNYYLHLRVAEPVSSENPFGLFDLEWDSYDTKSGAELASKSVNGFIKIYRKAVTNDLMLNFFDDSLIPNPWNSDWASYIKNQAIAQLDVKALMDENKEVTGYEIKGGDAHTAVNYAWNYVGNDPNFQGSSGGNDYSGSYSLAFDHDYIMTKYNLGENHWSKSQDNYWGSYDPEAPTCSTRNENWVNVWEYALFAPDGSRISQPSGYMIKTGKIHPEWNYPITGWFSRWGMWVEGVNDGETVQLVDWESGTETPFIYTVLNGRLMNKDWMDITAAQSANLILTCNSNCPKAPITQNDINNNTLYLTDGGPYSYTFNAATKKLSYNGQEVKFDTGVTATGTNFEWAWTVIDAAMTDADSNQFRYQMSLNTYNKPSALRVKNANGSAGAFFIVPDPIEFEPFTYIDAQHAYADNGNPAKDGSQFLFTYDGYLAGINWEAKPGRKDQWNNDVSAPEIVLKRGVELTAANSTGKVKAGDKIKLAPKVSQHTAKSRNFLDASHIGVTKEGCSMSLQERLAWIKHDLNLPVQNANQNTKQLIGVRPLGADGKEPPVLYSDGEPLKK
jgi:hypothetical protein